MDAFIEFVILRPMLAVAYAGLALAPLAFPLALMYLIFVR